MKKQLFFAALALTTLAGCTEDTFVGDQSPQKPLGEGVISFNYEFQNATRGESDHATSATNLGNQFIVWGEKSSGSADTKAAPADGHIVFPNYQVNYTANTAYNTTSNTKDWEYVGYTHSTNYQSNIKYKDVVTTPEVAAVNGSSAAQTIKYWDYSAGSYTFTAVSASKLDASSNTDIENGYVTIQKNINNSTSEYNKGYKVTVTANADLTKLYLSDRTIIKAGTGADRTAKNAYGGNVTLKFRNVLSQIRVGIYETIPGYAISDIHFFVTSDTEAKVSETDAFGAICPNIKGSGYAGDLTVTYSQESATINQPVVSASGTVNTNLILGTNISTVSTSSTLGESATSPTWDTADGAFTTVLLQGAHTTNLKLKCNYTLYNSVSGETINVTGATAEVPSQYLQWKANYKYTYLFKISDNTNGQTGTGSPAGLYPITFDAIEITNSDGLAEYITTVSEPSITTFGVNSTTGKYVTGGSEYAAGSDIYATFTEGSTVKTPTFGDSGAQHVNVFAVTTPDASNFPITEASVAEAIANPASKSVSVYTCTVTYTKVTDAATLASDTKYYKTDGTHEPGITGYSPTLAVSETDYHVDATPANSTITDGVDIYTCAVTDVTEVTDATTLTAGTTYYKKYGDIAPGSDGYVVTIAAEGTDYKVPVITATTITSANYSTYFTALPAKVTTVPGEDGVDKTIDALKLTGVKAGTYAIEYEASAAWTGSYKKVYKVIVVQ